MIDLDGLTRSEKFTELLRLAALNKSELSNRLGVRADTIYRWEEQIPDYAFAYLDLYIELMGLRAYVYGSGKGVEK